jgi:hypothetical protein
MAFLVSKDCVLRISKYQTSLSTALPKESLSTVRMTWKMTIFTPSNGSSNILRMEERRVMTILPVELMFHHGMSSIDFNLP